MTKKSFTVLAFLLFSIIIVFRSSAQTITLSPYSRYGIGEMQYSGYAYQRSMGGIGQGLQSTTKLNFLNPASYATDTLTIFEMGVDGTYMKLTDENSSQKSKNGNLSYLSLGFPIIKQKWSLNIGFVPFSAVGYEIKERKLTPVTANYFYTGNGGVNRFYIGNGFKIGNNLSVGLNASYLFGAVNRIRRVEFEQSGYLNNRYTNTTTISDIHLDYGLQYRFDLRDGYQLVAGISGSNSSKVNAKRSVLWENYVFRSASGDITSSRDTVQYTENEKGVINAPLNLTTGFFFSKENKWGAGLDFNYQDWSNYSSFGETDTLGNSFRFSIGGQITPDIKSQLYINRIEYRAGGYYHDGVLQVNGVSINDYGITAGFGFPLRKSYQSMINFSFEFGQRGTTSDNLVKESYTKLFIGITFNENWFQRLKYN